jgi:hypothetical protein
LGYPLSDPCSALARFLQGIEARQSRHL